jgi:hypothetical protein
MTADTGHLLVVVEATDLPGKRFADGDVARHQNIHIGLIMRGASAPPQPRVIPHRPWGVTDLVPGDAPTARWVFEIVVRDDTTAIAFGGPFVRGNRGDRDIGLAWGDMPGDGTFHLFRGAKLRLGDIAPDMITTAERTALALQARLGLTDSKGHPRCASVRPPHIIWSTTQT